MKKCSHKMFSQNPLPPKPYCTTKFAYLLSHATSQFPYCKSQITKQGEVDDIRLKSF